MELFYSAWSEFKELQVMEQTKWVLQALTKVCAVDRYEIGITVNDKVVGGLTLARDDDPHVGECLAVVSQYVLPTYRNNSVAFRCMRKAEQIARESGHDVLAWTHRVKDWTYLTRYRRIL